MLSKKYTWLLFFFIALTLPGKLFPQISQTEKLVIAFPPSIIEYHPLYTYSSTEAQLYTALYEGLLTYNPYTLQAVPAVAESWEINQAKTEYIFKLRQDAYYWDGNNVTADDFRNSWLTMLAPGNNSEYAFLLDIVEGAEKYRKGESNAADVGIKVIDSHTLKVILKSPAEHFLKILCHHSFVPVHPSFLKKRDWANMPSVPGNGPYYLLEKREDSLLLVKNQLYWDARNIEINQIEIIFPEDPDEVSQLFNEGKIHWASGNFRAETIENRNLIIFNTSFATNYFFFNCKNSIWADKDLRQIFMLAVPFDKIRDSNFLFFPASTLVPPIPQYPEISGYNKQDIDAALALLEKSAAVLPEEIIINIPDSFESARVAGLLKESWEEIFGISVNINIVSFAGYYLELKKDNYDLGTMSWIGDFPDPLTFLQMWTGASNLNDAGYEDSAFDKKIEDSLSLSGTQRYEVLSEAEAILLDSAIVLPVSFTPSINLVNVGLVSGWYPNPIDIHPVKYMKFRGKIINPGLVKAPKHFGSTFLTVNYLQ